jgi:ribosome-binding factor A
VADRIRSELAEALLRDTADPRVRSATVTSVDLSPDLRHATVHVSVLGLDDEREAAIQVLNRAQGHFRHSLARRAQLRTVPELRFRLDRGAELTQRITELLEESHDDD